MFEDPYQDPDPDEGKSEWSTKRILIRFFIYPFCIFGIYLGIQMMGNSENNKTFISGISLMAIMATYIYIDLKILLRKKK
jgi:hypothetical protein